jgi:ADP-ribose pyrophosphatase
MTQKEEKNIGPAVIKRSICYSGKWLKFEEITYKDSREQVRSWENIKRTPDRGAAVIIAVLRPSNRLVLIRQFRPPVDNYVIEFPAGLIDEGEDAKISALRELKEETGYKGKIIRVTNPVYSSPGLTDETVTIVFVDIDESDSENINPESFNEATEDIQVYLVERAEINEFLLERENRGDCIDAKLCTYALAH